MTGKALSPSRNRLLAAIREALSEHSDAHFIYVSLSEQATEEDFDGKNFLIKWVAWSLCDDTGASITESQLDFVGPEHTREELERDLESIFPQHKVHVDYDISFEDE